MVAPLRAAGFTKYVEFLLAACFVHSAEPLCAAGFVDLVTVGDCLVQSMEFC
jgi:hypothetical protein